MANKEHRKRLETLYLKHDKWLMQCAYNISKDSEVATDLVGQLYVYLGERVNQSLWYADSFNLMYARSFLSSRFLNKVKRDKKVLYTSDNDELLEEQDEVYDIDSDMRIDTAFDNVVNRLEELKGTKLWASAQIAQMYWFNDYTLDEVADEIGISKSTVFLSVKKIKKLLKEEIDNPFIKDK